MRQPRTVPTTGHRATGPDAAQPGSRTGGGSAPPVAAVGPVLARTGGRSGWPSSPLAAVGRAFDLLVAPPTRYLLDGTGVPGLPDGPLAMDRLRRLLLSGSTSAVTRDAVWREVVERTRRPAPEGAGWMVIAAGLALPGLTVAAAGLCRGRRGEEADIDAEVLAGFLDRLATVDVTGPRVVGRLIDAAARSGRRARRAGGEVPVGATWARQPSPPRDHPDWVLARAVSVGVLDRTEARLIGVTRLEGVPLVQAAAALRIDRRTAASWRRRAEARLRDAVLAGEVDTTDPMDARDPAACRHAARLARVKADRIRHRRRIRTGAQGTVDGPVRRTSPTGATA